MLSTTQRYLDDLSYQIRGAAMEVYNFFGPGLLEGLYEKALMQELALRGLKAESQVPVEVKYKGVVVSPDYRLDILVEDAIILELKSVDELNAIHYKQLRSYLKLSNKPIGWLINFNENDFSRGMIKVINRFYQDN